MERPVKPSDSITFLNAILVSYVGATTYKGDRIRIESVVTKEVIFISANHPYFSNTIDIALEYLTNKGFTFDSYACNKNNSYILMTHEYHNIK